MSPQRAIAPGLWFAISLALVAVLGPAGTDMYLSALPDVASELGSTAAQVQITLTVYLLAMGAGQLIFGPLIDRFGRRWPLLLGLIAFIAFSLWAALGASLEILILARFGQGLAAALTLVIALSMVRDVAAGATAAKLFALLMTIEGLAPVLAPTLGGYVDAQFGWRAVLIVLAGIGVLALVNSIFSLPETLPAGERSSISPRAILKTYSRIARDPAFLLPTLGLSAVFFFLFAYIGGATFVYQGEFNLPPDVFGLVFGGTGISVMIGAILSGKLVSRLPVSTVAAGATMLIVLGAAIALLAHALGGGLPGIVAGMIIALAGLGAAEATLMALAMDSQIIALGSTAALLGAFQLVISSAATPLAAALADWSTGGWLAFMLLSSLVALAIVLLAAHRARGAAGSLPERAKR